MTNKRIIIVNQDSGYLMIDLANEYVKKGYQVILITGRLVMRDKVLHKSIKVRHIKKYNRKTTINKVFSWLIGTIQTYFILFFHSKNNRILYVSNPPIGMFCSLLLKNKYQLLIYDIYPNVLWETGLVSKNSMIIRLWTTLNRRIFNKADSIYTISEGMSQVLKAYTPDREIKVIPIWTNSEYLKPIPKNDNLFLKKHSLEDKFIVLYSGNMGRTHDVESIVELARNSKDDHIHYLIIGDGEKKELIVKLVEDYQLENVSIMPFQPSEYLPFSLSSADVAIITLGKDASRLSIPSKTYSSMSVGSALLCIADDKSELAAIINTYKNGNCFMPHEIEKMYSFIEELASDAALLKSYQERSLNASKNYTFENVSKFLV